MAVNDVTTVITVNMAGGDSTDRQPGSGVEEMLLHIAGETFGAIPDGVVDMNVLMIDGTNNDAFMIENSAGKYVVSFFRMRMMADNTNYFRIIHLGATTQDYGFAVIAVG